MCIRGLLGYPKVIKKCGVYIFFGNSSFLILEYLSWATLNLLCLEATYNSTRVGGGRGFGSLCRNVCIWGIGERVALVVPSVASVLDPSTSLISYS